jgi:hypothetical protein
MTMTPKQKTRIAARLVAKNYGVTQLAARELIRFWFDAEEVPLNIPIEIFARAAGEYFTSRTGGKPTGAPLPHGRSACRRGWWCDGCCEPELPRARNLPANGFIQTTIGSMMLK